MEHRTNRKPFINLIVNFIVLFEISAPQFVRRFMKLWKKERDAQWAVKASWSRPFDAELQADFLGKKISKDEFSRRWNELWGFTESDLAFQDMIDKVFSACDDYQPEHRPDHGDAEDRLRSSVTEAFSSYYDAITQRQGLGSR